MDSGRLIFDSSALSHGSGGGHMLLLGSGNPLFRNGARSVLQGVEDGGGGGKRRPFFTAPDEYFDEEYYDEQLPEKKRRLTPEQVHLLERSFEAENKLEPERKSDLARKLGLQPRQVAVWFQNRRARWKTKQLERDFDCLKASYDSLLADHESLLKDNDRLQSQVLSLTEKLQAKEQSVSGVTEVKLSDQVGSNADLTVLNIKQKSEDRVSSGSGGSAVVDGDTTQQLVDSRFPEGYNCVGPSIQSEEDDASDEGCSYYPEQMFVEQHQPEEDAPFGWFWS